MLNNLEFMTLISDAMSQEHTEENFNNWHDALLLETDLADSGTQHILLRLQSLRFNPTKSYEAILDA